MRNKKEINWFDLRFGQRTLATSQLHYHKDHKDS